jgi:hypothetical protein
MMLVDRAKKLLRTFSTGEPASAFFGIFQGRVTFFAILYGIVGIGLVGVAVWGIVRGRDISQVAAIIAALAGFFGALQTALVAHSWKEDIHEQRMAELEVRRKTAGVITDLENAGTVKE